MNKQDIILKIARVLLKQEVPNWCWEVSNSFLKAKYLKQAKELYQIFVFEKILVEQNETPSAGKLTPCIPPPILADQCKCASSSGVALNLKTEADVLGKQTRPFIS